MGHDTYAVIWQEWSRSRGETRIRTKKREFKTDHARQKFVDKLAEKDNFHAFVAWANPTPSTGDES